MNDGFQPYCKGCIRDYYLNNSIKLIQKQKDYNLKNHDRIKQYKKENREKINEYNKKYTEHRRRTDINYRLIFIARSRIHKAPQ